MTLNNRKLGKTGYRVSEIGLGTWQLGEAFGAVSDDTARAILDVATRSGVNFWDTADVYGDGQSERRIGSYARAADVHVATKVGRSGKLFPDKFTRQGVRESLEGSARRLGVEILDLAQLHCVPRAVLDDGAIFTWMEDFQREGLVRFYGASVQTVEEGLLCMRHESVATLQIIFNVFRQDAIDRLLPEAEAKDVGIIVRLPLASGLLSGKFGKNQQFAPTDHRNFNRDGASFFVGETFSGLPFEKGVELSQELNSMVPEGWPMTHLALRWLLDQPAVSTIIAGVTKPHQLEDNVAAAERPPLSPELHRQLADWYRDKVRPHVRGGI